MDGEFFSRIISNRSNPSSLRRIFAKDTLLVVRLKGS